MLNLYAFLWSIPPSLLSVAHSRLFFSVYWSQSVMTGHLEHHRPAKSVRTPPTVEEVEGIRRQLGFNHRWKMMPCGPLRRKMHVDPKEVSSASAVAKWEALGVRLLVAASHHLQMVSCNPGARVKHVTNQHAPARPQVAHVLDPWIASIVPLRRLMRNYLMCPSFCKQITVRIIQQ